MCLMIPGKACTGSRTSCWMRSLRTSSMAMQGRQQDFHRAVYEDEDDDEDRYMILPKKKGIKGLVFLAVLEIIAILAVLGWWLQWLI